MKTPSDFDQPWMIRTYASLGSSERSRARLQGIVHRYEDSGASGPIPLSIAFCLSTQNGYDPDSPMTEGELGRAGVSIATLADMEDLLLGLKDRGGKTVGLDQLNTAMTINATAPYILGAYIALAEKQGLKISDLRGTIQNDAIKELLARHASIFDAATSLRIMTDVIEYATDHLPRWNPLNICSYHIHAVGSTPEQEAAFSLVNGLIYLDSIQGRIPDPEKFEQAAGRISFFTNSGPDIVREMAKFTVMERLWDKHLRERYAVQSPENRRFRAGCQVLSVDDVIGGPMDNHVMNTLSTLAATCGPSPVRALQVPGVMEPEQIPCTAEQSYSFNLQRLIQEKAGFAALRAVFATSSFYEKTVTEMQAAVEAIIEDVFGLYKREGLERAIVHMRDILGVEMGRRGPPQVAENGLEDPVARVLLAEKREEEALGRAEREAAIRARFKNYKHARTPQQSTAIEQSLSALKTALTQGRNIMPATIQAVRAGASVGEWTRAVESVHARRAPPVPSVVSDRALAASLFEADELSAAQAKVAELTRCLGETPRIVITKTGLDGHSNGAERMASAFLAAGFEVFYGNIGTSPEAAVQKALDAKTHAIGISVMTGGHIEHSDTVSELLAQNGMACPIFLGGVIPAKEIPALLRPRNTPSIMAVFTARDGDPLKNVNKVIENMLEFYGRKMVVGTGFEPVYS